MNGTLRSIVSAVPGRWSCPRRGPAPTLGPACQRAARRAYTARVFDPAAVVTGRPFRLTLGLRPLDPADWLEVDRDREPDLAEKRRLLSERFADVVATLPEGDSASAEVLAMVVAHLDRHHGLTAVPEPGCHPVDAAGRSVSEDLCVLTRSPDGWRLVAASVCFPSRWRLADKIGRTVGAIHEPVPGYESIAAATDAFFDRLTVERPMWRTNWSILESPQLFQAPAAGPLEEAGTGGRGSEGRVRDPGQLTMRVERQTLRRLPESGAAVFTIRTHRIPLAELVSRRPAAAADLAATLRTVPPATIRYKGWGRFMRPMLDWLESADGADRI